MAARRPDAVVGVGIDTGGTFTDVVAIGAGGRTEARKLPSTPTAPERAVLAALADVPGASHVRHGSTVATNALLERRGARVVFVTTAGFEDLIEIGRQDRPELYALVPERPEPLVPRPCRVGVRERLGAGGAVSHALTPAEISRVVERVRSLRPEAVAVGLLHAWSNPEHERRLGRALATLGVPVCLSSEIAPEIREVERFATTIANAFLLPRVSRYLGALARSHRARWAVVLSHGGTAPIERAAREPVRQLLSGPAAGLRAALSCARANGFRRALTLDVGGTSTDVAWLGGGDAGEDGLPRRRHRDVAGVPVLLPALDVQTVGAGGGSRVECDAGGLLRVGPRSAGAEPGPACYGRGGPATVTDAMVVLGRLAGDSLAGGAMRLDREASARAFVPLARALRRPLHAAAEGALRVANAHMEAALRRVSVERGQDPRGAAIVAFGGAGGLHAAELAETLGVRDVLWPRHAGVLCAFGALLAGDRRERGRSLLVSARETRVLERERRALERAVRGEFALRERARVTCECWVEARYAGQAHELPVPVPGGFADLAARFHRAHASRYGFADPTRDVVVVTLEVRGAVPDAPAPPPGRPARGRPVAARARARVSGVVRDVPVFDRERLAAGRHGAGPAVFADSGASLWVPARWHWRVARDGAVHLRAGGRR